jgi:hypothetical protein
MSEEILVLCGCGCRQPVEKPGNKYIIGHNTKGQSSWNAGMTGEQSHLFGRKQSDEHIKNAADAKRGMKMPEHIWRASVEARKGKPSWNKGLPKELSHRYGKKQSPETIRKRIETRIKNGTLKHTDETKKKLKEAALKQMSKPENHPRWKEDGDHQGYYHEKAWKLFGKDHCEHCGYTLIDHLKETGKRLDMHNNLVPKDYSIMEENAWVTLCSIASKNGCHKKLEDGVITLNKEQTTKC